LAVQAVRQTMAAAYSAVATSHFPNRAAAPKLDGLVLRINRRAMAPPQLCKHIRPGSYPFQTELVIDEHLGLAEAVVRCRECRLAYLLEMVDWSGHSRAYRVSCLAPEHAEHLVRTLTRGSCDIRRAGAEIQHLQTSSRLARQLLVVDMRGPVIEALVPLSDAVSIPTQGWRQLPCDGSWIAHARSYTQMANG
jgi:hypothetical protein